MACSTHSFDDDDEDWQRPELPDPSDRDAVMRYQMQQVNHEFYMHRNGAPVLAAVCLGSSGGSWFDENAGRYWVPTLDDLTLNGRGTVAMLEVLYDRPVHITVYLDT